MEGDREFWEEFINIYHLHTCLWNTKAKEYSDRNVRNEAYRELVQKCKEKFANANKDFVVKKIHTMRCSFRRELKKVINSLKSGSATDEVYVPSLWYYDLLSFIADSEMPRKGISNLDVEDDTGGETLQNEDTQDAELIENNESSDIDFSNIQSPSTEDGRTSRVSKISSTPSIAKRKKITQEKEFLNVATTALTNFNASNDYNKLPIHVDDKYDAMGKKIAFDLRSLSPDQLIFAEKLMSDVIYYARLKRLNEDSAVSVKQTQRFHPYHQDRPNYGQDFTNNYSNRTLTYTNLQPNNNTFSTSQPNAAQTQPFPILNEFLDFNNKE